MKLIKNIKLLIPDILPPGSPAEKFSSLILITLYILLVLRGELLGTSSATILFAVFSVFMLLLLLLSDKVRAPKFISLPILAFSLTLIASAVASQVPEESFKKIFIYLASFIFFFISYSLSHKYKKFLIWFLNITFIIGLYIVLKFFIIEVLSQNLQAGGKFIGPFFWHNQMAGYLLYLIPLPLISIFFKQKKQAFIWFIPLVFLLAALIFTFSRGAWMSFSISLIPLAYYLTRRSKVLKISKYLFLSGLIISFLFLLNSDAFTNRVKSISLEFIPSTRTTSGNLRASVFPSSFSAFSDYPLLGVGPGVFRQAFHKYQAQPWLYTNYAHNHFLQILVETGIFGLLSFSLIFIGLGRILIKYRNKYLKSVNERSLYIIALSLSLASAFIHNLIDIDWNLASLSLIFWSSAGTLLGGLGIANKDLLTFKKNHIKILYLLVISYSTIIFVLFYFNKHIQSGKNWFLKRDYHESQVGFSKVDAVFPYSYTSHLYQARIYQIGKIYDKALKKYNRSSTLNTFLAEPDYSQGLIYLELGDVERAKMHINEAIRKNPYSSPNFYKTLADIYFLEGDTINAANILKTAVTEAFPMNESYQNFSYLYKLTGFNKSLANIYLAYAQLLAQQENITEAKKVVEQATLYLDPDNTLLQELDTNLKKDLP